ncbi:putative malate dehydrogenase 1B [Littorina saxatilis]|uniref:Malate dehydrogenase, cytoplasmic n=1 Tax=Littorina saxatilis TaxID=31220 RepID=A0AAN9ASS5_9CAEN
MAKVVIAGHSDCPYFSRVELLGDRLVKNLPTFQLHKIVKTPEQWKTWLEQTCQERGWKHTRSPLVWRELIDRGGKGVLIGGHNDFQEYVKGYYGLESDIISDDMRKIGVENFKTKQEIDEEEAQFKALSKPLHVCITAASSSTCYGILPAIASGEVFGRKTELNLRLFDVSSADFSRIQGVAMEIQDLSEGLVRGIEVVDSTEKAFKDCSVVVILDELLQNKEEPYDEWISRNSDFFSEYARDIESHAKKNVQVLLGGSGPVNFNAMMMIKRAPNIHRQNIVAMSRAVENRAKAVIGQRLKVNTAGVVDLIIWGNANGKHFIDNSKSRVHGYDGAVWGPPSYSVPVMEMVHDNKWMEKEYLELVQQRKTTVETALGHPSSACEARAVTTMLTQWWNGSPHGQMFSLGVCSDGWYDVPEGLVFSYPVTMSPKGYWVVVQDMELTDETKQKLQECIKDLTNEMEVIYPPPRPPTPPKPDTPPATEMVEVSIEKRLSSEAIVEPAPEQTDMITEVKKSDSAEAAAKEDQDENSEVKESNSAEAAPTEGEAEAEEQ